MTPEGFSLALCRGAERVSAWAELLDSINVFPVADGDTGRNLAISLHPLRDTNCSIHSLQQELLLAARGNSGNISASFFTDLVACTHVGSLAEAARLGRERAYRAVSRPQPGTMLSFFDGLVQALQARPPLADPTGTTELMSVLERVVRKTVEQQPKLQEARVVDSGALGMFVFFEAFFGRLFGVETDRIPITNRFGDLIRIDSGWHARAERGRCVDVVLKLDKYSKTDLHGISDLCDEVVTFEQNGLVKAHLHTEHAQSVRGKLEQISSLVSWYSDDIEAQTEQFRNVSKQTVHVMTDAAGSVTVDDAKRLGLTLLSSYISIDQRSFAETRLEPSRLYHAMKEGKRASTSQASTYERHQHYQSILSLYSKVLYLCVGSVYTGNYRTVIDWKNANDSKDQIVVLDTGAASGRLGLSSMATALFARREPDPEKIVQYAKQAVLCCKEYIFLEKLQYLAAGGRLSKGSAFFGDALRMKPIITPLAEGATKVGVVRSRKQQVDFALERARNEIGADRFCYIMLEYSDNLDWLGSELKDLFQNRFPAAEVFLQPLSLTSGAHMGPGTWGLAFLQQPDPFYSDVKLK